MEDCILKTLLIKGGRVVDPKQNLDRITNVFVCDGKIAEITGEMPAADFVIDASGKIVSPGFIDIHMHEDDYDSKNDAILTSMSTSALHMGVTLDIGGNCGDNSMDPSRFLDITDRDGAPVNIGMLVGHTWLRNSGGKADKYSPISSDTLKAMINSCEEHLANGALGISFGVKYVPGTTDDEILGLSRLCRKGSKIVSSHVRADVDGVFDAADELARQLRLRDMGGIIVVDFIDMNLAEDRQMLYERMCKNMQKDRARHNILPLSKFGLMQITRQRVRPAIDVNVEENCPTCFGTGKIKSSILFVDQLERKIDSLVNKIGVKKFYLHVHPYVAAYINQGLISLKRKWQMKYGRGVHVVPSQKMAFLQYEFYDSEKHFIDMKEEIEGK